MNGTPKKTGADGVGEQVKGLLRILYGLAIATGLVQALGKCSKHCGDEKGYLAWLIAAVLLVGVADWLLVQIVLDRQHYKNLIRLLLDLVFPLIVFFQFWFVSEPILFLSLFAGYFVLGGVYNILLRIEPGAPELKWVGLTSWLVGAFSIVLLLFACCRRPFLMPLCVALVLALCGVAYFGVVMLNVSRELDRT
jgi:hypothetical protein